MRLKTGIWVAAYLRRCNVEGVFAAVRRHGAEEAGAIFVKINRLDGTCALYGPAPQSAFDEAQPADRLFVVLVGRDRPAAEADIEVRLTKEIRFDPDLWIIEVEDRAGRNFLDNVVQ
ncbi:MAG: DUF1491 family protein [Pseudolabrys sp.]